MINLQKIFNSIVLKIYGDMNCGQMNYGEMKCGNSCYGHMNSGLMNYGDSYRTAPLAISDFNYLFFNLILEI